MRLRYARGLLDLVSGRPETALSAFRAAERLAGLLVTEHTLARRLRAHTLQTLARLGQKQRAEQALASMDGPERDSGPMRNAIAVLRLAEDDPKAATAALGHGCSRTISRTRASSAPRARADSMSGWRRWESPEERSTMPSLPRR